jgi:hypothetical protein
VSGEGAVCDGNKWESAAVAKKIEIAKDESRNKRRKIEIAKDEKLN